MEVSQYGDTELNAHDLKAAIEKLKQCDTDMSKCKLEEEFEVLLLLLEF